MSADPQTFASIRIDLSPSPHLYARLPGHIKEGERQGIECTKERSELSSIQTRVLNGLGMHVKVLERSKQSTQMARQICEAYEAATAESRAYKAQPQAQASRAEETKGDAGASVDAVSPEGEGKTKANKAGAKK